MVLLQTEKAMPKTLIEKSEGLSTSATEKGLNTVSAGECLFLRETIIGTLCFLFSGCP